MVFEKKNNQKKMIDITFLTMFALVMAMDVLASSVE